MSSQIDNENIDSTYPVAGQDNDSQGFRDNFASIKANFGYAKTEIQDLQSKAILKSALTGGTLSNDLGGSNISNGTLTNVHGTSYSQTIQTTGDINIVNGALQVFTVNDDATLTFKNWPSTNKYANVRTHFRSGVSAISVGNDIEVGRRYTIDQINNTNFALMGATPTAVFSGNISGTILTAITFTSGSLATLTIGTVISGANVIAGTRITQNKSTNPSLDVDEFTVSVPYPTPVNGGGQSWTGMTSGVVFEATSQGSGTGTVKKWVEVTLQTEGVGEVIAASEFAVPLVLNPNQTHQAIEAWSYTDSPRKVYLGYVGNLDPNEINYTSLNIGTLHAQETIDSDATDTGTIVVAGGVGVGKNLYVGGDVVITGRVIAQTLGSVLPSSTTTIANIDDIQNVNISDLRVGDGLKYDGTNWTNQVDTVEYVVTTPDVGDPDPFNFQLGAGLAVPISQAGLKFSVGKKYRFDLTNAGAKMLFSRLPDISVSSAANATYSDGVTVGTDYVEIFVTDLTPSPLFVYAPADGPKSGALMGQAWPIQVAGGPILVVKDYSPTGTESIIVNTSTSAVKITLPANPTLGTTITVVDNGNAGTNNITIGPSSSLSVDINGQTYTPGTGIVIAGNYGGMTLVSDGTNWTALRLSFNGSDDVADEEDISLNTAVSYFATEGDETSQLAAGTEGQVKTLIMSAYVGSMTVAVTNAGWIVGAGAGDIVFDQKGDSCTLQFINNAWYLVSNNGCKFSSSSPVLAVNIPASASSAGKAGTIAYDPTYLYICTATNTWKRVALATWP